MLLISLAIAASVIVVLADPTRHSMLALAALASAVVLVWSVVQTVRDPLWLILALVFAEHVPYLNLIPAEPDSRWWIRYPLLLAFCLPALPAVARSDIWKSRHFKGFLIFFGWATISIGYSLYPGISAGRLFPVVLNFLVLSFVAAHVHSEDDVQKVLGRFLIGTSIFIALSAIAALLPQNIYIEGDMTHGSGIYNWMLDESGILRFCGFFYQPNTIGALVITTFGAGSLHWRATSGWRRWMLAFAMIGCVVLGMMADSRSCFVATAVGAALFLIWRYKARGVLILLGCAAVAFAAYISIGRFDQTYLNRDVTTLTGRTEAWAFEVRKLEHNPLRGYGFDVEGAIFEDPHFPDWNKFWAAGPNTSLHESYLSVAIGMGLPALLLWFYLIFAPWVTMFRTGDDPWRLRRVFFLVVVPMLILGIDESGTAEPRYMNGLLFYMVWMLAERYLMISRQSLGARREIRQNFPRPAGKDPHTIRTERGVDFTRLFAKSWMFAPVVMLSALMAFAHSAAAADYYVDSANGNDAHSGASLSAAWQTLEKINHYSFRPGDVVHLNSGSVFRATLRPDGADHANFRGVSFVAYGNGDPPIITGSDLVSSWSPSSGQIFVSAQPKSVFNVFVDGRPGWGVTHACCLPGQECAPSRPLTRGQTCAIGPMRPGSWMQAGGNLYLWLIDNSSPSKHAVEVVTREFAMQGWCRKDQLDGLKLQGLWFTKAGLRGISLESEDSAGREHPEGKGISGLVIKNCVVQQTGTGPVDDGSYGNAITIINSTAPLLEGNRVSWSGNHGNCINVQNANGARIMDNWVDHWNHNGIDVKGSSDVLVENNVATDHREGGAGFYTEHSSAVSFIGDRARNVSNGFQICLDSSVSVVNSTVEHASTCVYFGPQAKSLVLRNNTGHGCQETVNSDRPSGIVQEGNQWSGL